jgi:hypothetical protein
MPNCWYSCVLTSNKNSEVHCARRMQGCRRGGAKVKVKFVLEHAMKAQRGSRVYLYSFFNLGARWGWVVKVTPRPLYTRKRDPVPNCTEVWLGHRASMDGCGKSLPHRDSSPWTSSL